MLEFLETGVGKAFHLSLPFPHFFRNSLFHKSHNYEYRD